MTKQTKLPERIDILKMIERELYDQGREDINIEVAFVVNFDAGNPAVINTIIDPHQPFPRWKCKQFVKSILERIKEMEAIGDGKIAVSPEIILSSNPAQISEAVPEAL